MSVAPDIFESWRSLSAGIDEAAIEKDRDPSGEGVNKLKKNPITSWVYSAVVDALENVFDYLVWEGGYLRHCL